MVSTGTAFPHPSSSRRAAWSTVSRRGERRRPVVLARPPERAAWSSRGPGRRQRLPVGGERAELAGAVRDREAPVKVLTDQYAEPGATPAAGLGRDLEDQAPQRDCVVSRHHALVLATEDRVEVDRAQRTNALAGSRGAHANVALCTGRKCSAR